MHVLGAPPAFILSQDRTLRPKYMGLELVRSSQSFADRFRSIHMVLFDRKRNSRGRLSAALRKTNPSQTISNGSMSARMRHIWCVHPRSIRFSRCTPARLIRSDRAARQGDILPDRRGPRGGNPALHILFTNEPEGPGIRQGLIDDHISQTDRMTSVFMLSDVYVSVIYPNQN